MSQLTAGDGTRLYFQDWGSGRPVVLLGTAMMSSVMWEHQAAFLAGSGYRCVSYDRRGCGRSDRPWSGYDYDTLADDLAALLEHLDLRETTLVGYAVGGGEAVRYLARHGDARIAQLALVASTTPYLGDAPDNPTGIDATVVEGLLAAMTTDRARWMTELAGPFFGGTPDAPAVSAEFAAWMVGVGLDCSPRAATELYRTLLTTDQRAETAAVAVPTLIVHGDADQGAPWQLCGRPTSELLPDARVVRYPDAAHGLFATHAARFDADLLTFLSEAPSPSATSRPAGGTPPSPVLR